MEELYSLDLLIAVIFIAMSFAGFFIFKQNKVHDDYSEEQRKMVKKKKIMGFSISGVEFLIGLYFGIRYYYDIDLLTYLWQILQ